MYSIKLRKNRAATSSAKKESSNFECLEPRLLFNAILSSAKVKALKANLSITGSVFIDLNDNGTQDAGEPAASKITVFIDTNNNGGMDKGETKAVTNAKGAFTLKKLAAGTYTVDVLAGSTQTVTDPSAGSYSISVASGVTPTAAIFGLADEYRLAPKVTQYNLFATTNVANIIAGPDGNLYFNMPGQNAIGQITPGGTITQFTIPEKTANPNDLTVGSDGNIWFTETGTNSLNSVTTTGTFGIAISIPTAQSNIFGMTTGPDGNVWFTEAVGNKIGTVRNGSIVEYTIPTTASVPTDITPGNNSSLWFVELYANAIASITTAGSVTEYPVPAADGVPQELALGPNGNIWFTLQSPAAIGKITPTGQITTYLIPSSVLPPGTTSSPHGILVGSDGAIYFTDSGASAIGRITTSGQITETLLPTTGTTPTNIAQVSNGTLWFAETHTNQLGTFVSGNSVSISKSHAKKSTLYDVADFGDRDPAANTKEYKATINWGDGTTSAAKIATGSNGLFEVLGSHIYAHTGTFNLSILVQDTSGAEYSALGAAIVTS